MVIGIEFITCTIYIRDDKRKDSVLIVQVSEQALNKFYWVIPMQVKFNHRESKGLYWGTVYLNSLTHILSQSSENSKWRY